MDFSALEILIAAFLNGKISNPKVEVNPIPESEADFKKVFGKEVVLVAFSDEEPDTNSKSVGAVYQETEITFAFLIQSKSLRGNEDKLGIYAIHKLIKKHIIGYEPVSGQPFRYAGFKMQDKVDDIFNYAVFFKTKGVAIQYTDNDDSETVNLESLTFKQPS